MPLPERAMSTRLLVRLALGLLLLMLGLGVSAQPRAWLDRDRIGAAETVTLNIETTSTTSGAPDYGPLQAEFQVSGHTSRRQFEVRNGRSVSRTLYAAALRPLREGVLTVPALTVGGERTQPLPLVVSAANTRRPVRAGDDVFIESEADDQDPYVQQSVGWVVRLYSAVPLVSGQLDQPGPDGASLQRVGDDAQYSRDIDGRRYTVVERHYQLVPERSGTLTIPGASFEGRGTGGFFDDMFGDRGGALQAQAAPRFLQVRAVPANAPQPWLPLHGLQLRYLATPQDLKVGSAATLVIEATADGATAAQMPELLLPAIDGVQVFAEPVQADESFANGRPRVKLARKFSLVPARAGDVRLPGFRLGWWDVGAGSVRTASLPALSWQIAAADGSTAAASAATTADGAAATTGGSPAAAATKLGANSPWALAAVVFAALWLVTLVWAMQRRVQAAPAAHTGHKTGAAPPPAPNGAALKQALATGDFGEVADALCAMARPPVRDIDALLDRLDDAGQRNAVHALQRARWGDGDGATTRAQLRKAFAQGPRWRAVAVPPPSPLPPLYPPRN